MSLAAKGLDFVVNPLNLASRDVKCSMGNGALEMAIQKSAKLGLV